MFLMDCDAGVIGSHGDFLHAGHSRVALALMLGDDIEGGQPICIDARAASSCQLVTAGPMKISVQAIKGMVVMVSPHPAPGLIIGYAHPLAVSLCACFLGPTGDTLAWVCGKRRHVLERLPTTSTAVPRIYPYNVPGRLALNVATRETGF